ITRLLQSGLIKPEELPHKYQHEIHANDIVLLAYYIAAINIETVYHDLVGQESGYQPFEGICLTDTFQMYETKDMLNELLPINSARRKRQVALPIRVIMGNPPYSVGQKSANDNAQNVAYPLLDQRIRETYVKHSTATSRKNLYDSYIRAIRWGSDRLGDAGIMAYVTGGAWIERYFADGLRKCLADDFTNLYVFSLRGDIRKNMLSSGSAKEGENVFGSGSMTGIAISLFVKNPAINTHGNIYFHDIGNDLGRQEKLEIIGQFGSVHGITIQGGWQKVMPDENHDWLNQVKQEFDEFLVFGDKKDRTATPVFRNYSSGVKTNRDAWCYNASRDVMLSNTHSMIAIYNSQRLQYHQTPENWRKKLNEFINTDKKKISWTVALKQDLEKNKALGFDEGEALISAYRPFTKRWVYYSRRLNERVYQMPQIFPNATAENRVICVSGIGARSGFSTLMVDSIPSFDMLEKGQCFPFNLYDKIEDGDSGGLFQEQDNSGYRKQDGISDTALTHFQSAYPGATIIKEDLFYYLYGILHSEDYRDQFRNNLMKQLPRLPVVSDVADFRAFREAGRALAELHLGYEKVGPYAVTINAGEGLPQTTSPETLYRVVKMKHDKDKGRNPDRTRVIYNTHITLSDIPLDAYDYVVNGKSAIQWVIERQGVKTDKASGIVNDANNYAIETMQNPAYPLELLQRIITVSIETMKVVRGLPPLRV
ncbi:MAG: damage-inducible protein, partial [Gammaproteobacteria bacterium]|nr:damage-inducible protein [Gammaproteobacteria bacterium]